jgi:murein DD-endopeptidase MepM/ murein hydrolase activator NlpD
MAKAISSPLISAANAISSLGNNSNREFGSAKRSYKQFIDFLDVGVDKVEAVKLPKDKKIRDLSNINIASNFGSAGNLIKNLASGAFDAAQFVTGFFPGAGEVGKPKASSGKPKLPNTTGSKIRFSGLRSIGIVNAVFAGLDFAQGLQEGEGAAKAATGAVGSLAGSLLGGAIGQALIPIPGVGFVVGSMAGGFLGGYAADRAVDATSGKSSLEQKQKERLKAQEQSQKNLASGDKKIPGIMRQFSESVEKFEKFANQTFRSAMTAAGAEEMPMEYGPPEPDLKPGQDTGQELQDMESEGGKIPSKSIITSGYGWRWGRQHWGTDYGEPEGTPVSVIQPGTVAFAGFTEGGGNTVHINHPDGSQTRYLHFQKSPNVRNGQAIEPGTVIGYVGSTGRSTGPHLHFEYAPPGQGSINSAPYADKYFRFGGNVKVKPKKDSGAGLSSGGPTAVVMAGTNDTDPKKAAANIQKSIEELKSKGYNVVVVPPSQQQGSPYANIGAAVEQAAKQSGATVEKGNYKGSGDQYPFAHLDPTSVKSLQQKYKGARFIGDSNAENFQGSMNYRGKDSGFILQQIQSMQNVRPVGGAEFDPSSMTPEQIQEYQNYVMGVPTKQMVSSVEMYPDYNRPGQSSMTYIPIMMGSSGGSQQQRPVIVSAGGGGGGGTVVLPGPTEGQVVNSLMKTMLLTNLSAA